MAWVEETGELRLIKAFICEFLGFCSFLDCKRLHTKFSLRNVVLSVLEGFGG
jgi:hypothetical protein